MVLKEIALTTLMVLGALALPAPALCDGLERGKVLFEFCQQCHGPDGGGMALSLAPAIAGQQQWYLEAQLHAFRTGKRGLHPDDLGGLRMYPMSLWLETEEDANAVAAYVASLPEVSPAPTLHSGDSAKGEVLFAICKTCHGAQAEGMEPMKTPALAGLNDWYLLSTLKKFKAGVRGGNPENTNAVVMRGMAATLPDENAIHDVIAYILTLKASDPRQEQLAAHRKIRE